MLEPFPFAVELQECIKSPLLLNYYVINQKKKTDEDFFPCLYVFYYPYMNISKLVIQSIVLVNVMKLDF